MIQKFEDPATVGPSRLSDHGTGLTVGITNSYRRRPFVRAYLCPSVAKGTIIGDGDDHWGQADVFIASEYENDIRIWIEELVDIDQIHDKETKFLD